jgi:hypothetical protein
MEGLPISEQLSNPSVVTQIIAGTNITIDQPNGNVTVNSSGGGGGGEVFQATYYKSAQQNLTSGSTDMTFDEEGSWNNDNGYITHTGGSADFTVVQAGLYQLEFNATVIANGSTWTNLLKQISIDITRSPTPEIVSIAQNASMPSNTNYGQSACATYNLEAGDVINCRISNTFATGTPYAQGVTSTIDLNTWFTWRYVASGGATPAGGVTSIAGVDGAVTLSSPGGSITIAANGQDIELSANAVLSVAAGAGVTVETVSGVATVANDGVLSMSDGATSSIGGIILSGSSGVSVLNTAGTFAITNTGVVSTLGGSGISVSSETGTVTIGNTGLISASAGAGIGVSTTTGVLTIENKGVRTLADLSGAIILTGGTGVGVVTNIESNTITLSNTGITSISAGTAMFVSTTSGVATITNRGVQTFFDLSGAITVSATGATISKAGQNIDWTVNFPTPPVDSVNAQTGAILIEAGAGITVNNTETPSIQIVNDGVTSTIGGNGISCSAPNGSVTIETIAPVYNYSQVLTSTIINSSVYTAVDLLHMSTLRSAAPVAAWGTALLTDRGSASGSQIDLYLNINGAAGQVQRVDIVKDHSQSFALMGSGTGPTPGGDMSVSLYASTITGDVQVTFANAMAFSDMYLTL